MFAIIQRHGQADSLFAVMRNSSILTRVFVCVFQRILGRSCVSCFPACETSFSSRFGIFDCPISLVAIYRVDANLSPCWPAVCSQSRSLAGFRAPARADVLRRGLAGSSHQRPSWTSSRRQLEEVPVPRVRALPESASSSLMQGVCTTELQKSS